MEALYPAPVLAAGNTHTTEPTSNAKCPKRLHNSFDIYKTYLKNAKKG
ncbi:hypothetical protein GWO68_03410 [Pontibacter sp. BT213]|uniref:Uncharacterized protein n=1 Tax=Pontibacter fetidus TaxID=2700082 RepID=A0A6B2H3T8_9BACT|nr:hypothetical protein [Pontibacter fetidus]